MATKDHYCLKGDNQQFGSSNQNGQYSNLNLNANQKCSSILETFQSNKSISTSSNSKKNDYVSFEIKDTAATTIQVLDQIDSGKNQNQNNLFSWNQNGDGRNNFSNDSNIFGSTKIGENKNRWHKNDGTKKSSSGNNSTLSLHITAYENSLEAQNELNSSSEAKNDGTNLLKRKINKVLEVLKTGFASMDAFEIPRQQTSDSSTVPEIMGFKASQKLQNPNSAATTQPNNSIAQQNSSSVGSQGGKDDLNIEYGVPIITPAFHNIAHLGDLYDARTGTFTGTSMLRSDVLDKAIVTENGNQTFRFLCEDSISDKQDKLEIEGEISLNILCNAISASGTGKYMKSSTSKARETTGTLKYKVTTRNEKININSIKDQIVLDSIKNSSATHVVTAIQYGGYALIDLKYKLDENEERKKVRAELKLKLLVILNARGQGNIDEHDRRKHEKFELNCYIDGLPEEGQRLPMTVEEANKFIRAAPSMIRKVNNGKGVPITYVLTPVRNFKNTLEQMEFSDRAVRSIDNYVTEQVLQVFGKMIESENLLCQLDYEFGSFSDYVDDKVLDSIASKLQELRTARLKLEKDLRQSLIEVRYGRKDDNVLIDALQEHYKSELSPEKLKLFGNQFLPDKVKIKYIKNLMKKGVICVGKGTTVELERMDHDLKDFYEYYCDWSDKSKRAENSDVFMELTAKRTLAIENGASTTEGETSTKEEKKLIFIDLQVNPEAKDENVPAGNRICQYVNRRCLDADYLQAHKKHSSKAVATCTTKQKYAKEKPNKRVNFDCPCPLSFKKSQHHCAKKDYEWHCSNCGSRLQYDFNKHFYCDCGYADVGDFAFRCTDSYHGSEDVKFEEAELLMDIVDKIRLHNFVDILIFSESGVDTEEWINRYANYLTHANSSSAAQNVTVHRDYTTGQHFSTHIFSFGKKIIRFTNIHKYPNLTDGDEMSKTILSVTSKYGPEFHGIFILVKFDNPPENRDIVLKEITANFSPSVAKNIVFCMAPYSTDGVFTFFNNTTVIANFGIVVTPETKYFMERESYENNAKEANRLFAHITNDVTPHNAEETIKIALEKVKRIEKKENMIRLIITHVDNATSNVVSVKEVRDKVIPPSTRTNDDLILWTECEDYVQTKCCLIRIEKRYYLSGESVECFIRNPV